ncbi:adenylyl-sulfate kinase [Massilia sp. TS11]|uniref:adenylyl-sulfate kinase n=1 Tax=Massilia sp. TS11 TaxID=2908003 RepID=UPI001EDB3AF4|nr:adenylyl-sulfate kinase [Massilia sp. TS11]MCG2582822.1 adenylyl-sulfate kinase [Massilia sp. TS11]
MSAANLVWHKGTIERPSRAVANQHGSGVIWLTGLSGAGKSTIASRVEASLHASGCRTFVLDGDNLRHGLCSDLGFSTEDRRENVRRVGEVARLFVDAGLIVIVALISPFKSDRERVRQLFGANEFFEVYCDCALDVCEARDPKGLYKRARAGEIPNFTGLASPYEPPDHPELILKTASATLEQCSQEVVGLLHRYDVVPNISVLP